VPNNKDYYISYDLVDMELDGRRGTSIQIVIKETYRAYLRRQFRPLIQRVRSFLGKANVWHFGLVTVGIIGVGIGIQSLPVVMVGAGGSALFIGAVAFDLIRS